MKKPTQMLLKKKLEMNLAGVSASFCCGRCGLRVGMCTISGSSELESAIGEVRERCPSCREGRRRRLGNEGKGEGERRNNGDGGEGKEVFEEERFLLCLPLGRLFKRTVVASTTFSLFFYLTKIGGNN